MTTRAFRKVLSDRALNRALLARQHLLARTRAPVARVLEGLVGLQAQVPDGPYFALWARLEGFRPEALGAMLEARQVVRLALLRGTLHLVTARDCRALRPVVQPVLDRLLVSGSPFGRRLGGLDAQVVAEVGRALVEERPRTLAELRAALGARWPGHDADAMAYAVHYSLPLVQVPPRGVWKKAGRPTCTTATHWLGEPLGAGVSRARLVRRYLAAFGPASVADAQAWCGLTGLAAVFERLRPRLETFRGEDGRELFDVPGGPRPDPETPAPVRFLPEYDNAWLGHAQRTRIVRAADVKRVPETTQTFGFLLVDGFVAGIWKIVRRGRAPALRVVPFGRTPAQVKAAVTEEGARLLAFAGAAGAPVQIAATL